MARRSHVGLVSRIKRWFAGRPRILAGGFATAAFLTVSLASAQPAPEATAAQPTVAQPKIGRASCRERV